MYVRREFTKLTSITGHKTEHQFHYLTYYSLSDL